MDVPAQEEEKKAKTNKNSNNYETPNILKWKKKAKNIKKILNNIDKNIENYFIKKFTVIKLVYLIIKNANKITRWNMENKIEEAQNTNKLNKSVGDRIKLIKSMNNKIYEKLLRDNNFENNKLKLWVSSIQSEFIQKTPSILHCYREFINTQKSYRTEIF